MPENWKRFLCKGMTCRTNLKRDFVLIGAYVIVLALLIFAVMSNLSFKKERMEKAAEIPPVLSEMEVYEEVKAVQETVNVGNWKKYQSKWYGIELKYPENWPAPKGQGAIKGSAWEYAYQFRRNGTEKNDPFIGFDVVIYNLDKTKEIYETNEFPSVKNADLKNQGRCETIEGHLIETGDYPAEEIYIPPADDCYNSALFFSFTKGQYIYNIVPVFSGSGMTGGDPRVETIDNFPEFFASIATLETIDIMRPRPVAAKPRITAPKPYAATLQDSLGRTVCANKSDRPKKSDKGKGKHLDMECCLDPDEYPNPWCYYDPAKYGKYL